MKIFDPYIRSRTQSEDDLKNLRYFGTEQVVTTAHGGQSFETTGDISEYFERLVGEECERLRRCDLEPHVALGVVPDARPRRAHPGVWPVLEEMLQRPPVVALGEVGVWRDEDDHWELFERQIRMARRVGPLPVLVTPPDRLKVTMTYKMMNWLDKQGYPTSLVVMTCVDEQLLENVVESGFCAGLPVGSASNDPREIGELIGEVTSRVEAADRILLTSALRSSGGDLLGVPKSIESLQEAGVDDEAIDQMVYANAARLFGDDTSQGG